MRSYSPYDNVSYAQYPPVLITASEQDSRVSFVNILKYLKRLRSKAVARQQESFCKQNFVLNVQEGGHFGQGDLESEAVMWGFLDKVIKPPELSS